LYNHGVTVKGVWFDHEGLPHPYNGVYEVQRECFSSSYPSWALTSKNAFKEYCFPLRSTVLSAAMADAVLDIYPNALTGNYRHVGSTHEHYDINYEREKTPPYSMGAFNASMPVAYANTKILPDYFEAAETVTQSKVDDIYLHNLLKAVTIACQNKGDNLCIPFVSRRVVDNDDAKWKNWDMSSTWFREICRHMLMRGADSFYIFNLGHHSSYYVTPEQSFESIEDVRSVLDELLGQADFLAQGMPITHKIPELYSDGVLWSGLWNDDQCLVRARSLSGSSQTVSICPFPGSLPVSITATAAGSYHTINRVAEGGSRIASWPMDDNFADKDAKFYDGIPMNGASISSKTAVLDGANDYISINGLRGDFSISDSSQDFTFSSWIRPHAVTSRRIIYCEASGMTQYEYALISINNSRIYVKIYDYQDGTRLEYTGSTVIAANQWQHVVVKRNGTSFVTYINGQLDGQGTYNPSSLDFGTKNYALGAKVSYNQTSLFDGALDEIHLYDRSLEFGEIINLYKEGLQLFGRLNFDGTYADAMEQQNDGTPEGDPSFVGTTPFEPKDAVIGSQALAFDGNDWVDVPGLSGRLSMAEPSVNFAFRAWIKPVDATETQVIYSEGASTTKYEVAKIFLSGSKVRVYIRDYEDGVRLDYSTASSVPSGEWTHVTVTAAGNSFTTYINGVSNGSGTFNPAELAGYPQHTLGCWNYYTQAEFFDGAMDDVELYENFLSSNTVNTLYEADLIAAEWNFNNNELDASGKEPGKK
jgi:hypothetical protein